MSNVEESRDVKVRRAVTILSGLRVELSQLTKTELLQPNVDAVTALTLVRRVLSGLSELRLQMQQLPCFDIDNLERLELFAMAFLGAQAQYAATKERNKEPAALVAEGVVLRARLLSDAKALVRRGLLAVDPLNKLRGGRGYKQVAADLLLLAVLLETRYESLAEKSVTTRKEIARAEALADKLTIVVSERREPRKAEVEALDTRMRAFTLFFRAYSQVRRAVQYLRFDEGDADCIAPSLTGNRKPRKTRNKTEVELSGAVSSKGDDTKATVNDHRATLVNPAGADQKVPVEDAPTKTNVAVGLPGSDPFLN